MDKLTSELDRLSNPSPKQKQQQQQKYPRLRINLSDIRHHNSILAQQLRLDPFRHLRAIEHAVHTIANEEREGYDLKLRSKFRVSLTGPVSAQPSSPRTLTSVALGQLVCVEGVATKVSSTKPKLVKSVHYCPVTGQHEEREYRDGTDEELNLPALDAYGNELPDRVMSVTSSVYPTSDKNGNALETEYGMSQYKDYQVLTLQEMPERAPHGQLPRSVDIILHRDLVDVVKPGDRVQVVGVYRALAPGAGAAQTSGLFRTVVIGNCVQTLHSRDSNSKTAQLLFKPDDIGHIRSLASSYNHQVLQVLGRSLAPGIHGHEVIKQALILQLLGGCERVLDTGTKLRGDINCLLLGDPSTAKSQLLRAVMHLAPLAISTTGKGSSGVGLTAAVTSDPDTKERKLEAGAMVLADRGVVLIDEFDKMSEADRVAIHEAMEQQTITIAKAGIYASLNARCSVLAAANPVYGQYDKTRRVQENIGLPDSLLSRFDLLFVVLDSMDPEQDRCIAGHVLAGHRYRRPGTSGMEPDTAVEYGDSDDEDDEVQLARKNQQSIWQRSHISQLNGDDDKHILNQEFLRKYLHFAKTRIQPVLSEDAREAIATRYAEMRSRQDERTLPVTARSLETIIRLASANAKARLSQVVEAEPDVSTAMDILAFALYHEHKNVASSEEKGTSAVAVSESSDSDSEIDSQDQVITEPLNKKARVENTSTNTITTSTDMTIETVKQRIWEVVCAAGDSGEVSLKDICSDIEYDVKLEAVRQMEDRIMEDDGMLYMV